MGMGGDLDGEKTCGMRLGWDKHGEMGADGERFRLLVAGMRTRLAL